MGTEIWNQAVIAMFTFNSASKTTNLVEWDWMDGWMDG